MIKQTEAMCRCPKCNGDNIFIDVEHTGIIWGCGIGCKNIGCSECGSLVIKYALSEKKAQQKAVTAWNKRCNRG